MTAWLLDHQQPLLDDSFPLPVLEPFTARMALDAGLTRHQLRLLYDAALIRRVTRGVYAAAQLVDSRTLRAQALHLVVPDGCVVTDWSASWLWTGVDAPGDHLREPAPHVFRVAGQPRLRNGVCLSGTRTFRPDDLVDVDGLLVTTPLRTAWDLGRLAPRDWAIGALDALLRLGVFDLAELVDGVSRFKGARGVVQLRELAPLADPRAESPRESVLRLRWLDLPSLPPPTPQVPITVGAKLIYAIDLGVEELRFGCEYDGEEFHVDEATDADRREDLERRFGWDVIGVRSANLFGPTRDIEGRLYRGVDRARRAMGRRSS